MCTSTYGLPEIWRFEPTGSCGCVAAWSSAAAGLLHAIFPAAAAAVLCRCTAANLISSAQSAVHSVAEMVSLRMQEVGCSGRRAPASVPIAVGGPLSCGQSGGGGGWDGRTCSRRTIHHMHPYISQHLSCLIIFIKLSQGCFDSSHKLFRQQLIACRLHPEQQLVLNLLWKVRQYTLFGFPKTRGPVPATRQAGLSCPASRDSLAR